MSPGNVRSVDPNPVMVSINPIARRPDVANWSDIIVRTVHVIRPVSHSNRDDYSVRG